MQATETTTRKKRDFASDGPQYDPRCRRWLVDISYPDGSRRRRRFRRERQASRFWIAEHSSIEDGTWKKSRRPEHTITLDELLDIYMRSHAQCRSYETWISESVRFWKEQLDPASPVSEITADRIDRIKNAYLATGVAPASVDRKLELLRAAFNLAIQRGLCSFSPMTGVKLLRVNNERLRYFTGDEHPRLIAAARLGPSYLEPLIQLSIHTGTRRRNLTDLTWPQVDLNNRLVRITKTKSNKTVAIPLDDTALSVLQDLRARSDGSQRVFPELQGVTSIKKAWSTCLRRAGITELRWHDLRHCFAAALAQSDVDINTIRELLGHSDIRSTLRYAHLAPGYLADKVKVLDRTLPKDCQSAAPIGGNRKQGPARETAAKLVKTNAKR
jgi:integrase